MEQIIKLLKDHGIEMEVSDRRVYAFEYFKDRITNKSGCKRIDITDWTVKDAIEWLGY